MVGALMPPADAASCEAQLEGNVDDGDADDLTAHWACGGAIGGSHLSTQEPEAPACGCACPSGGAEPAQWPLAERPPAAAAAEATTADAAGTDADADVFLEAADDDVDVDVDARPAAASTLTVDGVLALASALVGGSSSKSSSGSGKGGAVAPPAAAPASSSVAGRRPPELPSPLLERGRAAWLDSARDVRVSAFQRDVSSALALAGASDSALYAVWLVFLCCSITSATVYVQARCVKQR